MSQKLPSTPVQRKKLDDDEVQVHRHNSIPPLTPFQSFRPHRTSALHHVTSFTPDMSPISPSAIAPSSECYDSFTSFSKMIHSSSAAASRRNSKTNSSNLTSSPTLYYGPSTSVSSLGLESGFLLKHGNKKTNNGTNGNHKFRKYRTSSSDSSSSSSDDDELIAAAYDSDDRMSLSSRRPSTSSIKGLPDDMGFNTTNSSVNTSTNTSVNTSTNSSTSTFTPNTTNTTSTTSSSTAIVRQIMSNGRSLKPKMKSFLRISKDLQEEMSPLDYEIRREAEVTSTFREEDLIKTTVPIAVTPSTLFRLNEGSTFSSSSSPSSSSFHHQDLIARLEKFAPRLTSSSNKDNNSAIISDTDDSDVPPLSVTPSVKRKVTFLDDSPVANIKRRAVSPGLASPVIGSPTSSHISRRASIKQVYDTSDGFQNLHLI